MIPTASACEVTPDNQLMRVLIFEPQFVGHNLAYVHHLSERLLDMGCEVHLVTSTEAVASEEFASHLHDVVDALHVTALPTFSKRPSRRSIRVNGPSGLLGLMRSMLIALRTIQPEHVYIPFGNPLASCCGFPNPVSHWLRRHGVEAEILLLSGKYAHVNHDWVARLKERIALEILDRGPWTRIHHIVPHAIEKMRAHSPRLKRIASLLPDPVETPPSMNREEARRMLGLPADGRMVSISGLIEPRKGIAELLDAFERSGSRLRVDDRLLLAGKGTPEVRELLRTRYSEGLASGRIRFLDRHLTSEELWAACIAADLVCTPYPQHLFSASIVIRASRVRVPVLANAIGWMEQTIHQFGLGTTCDTLNPTAFANALVSSLESSGEFKLRRAAERFIAFHTPENFAARLTDRVAQRIGCPAYGRGLPWEDVICDTSAAFLPT